MSETSKYFPPEVHDVISSSADRTYPNGKDVNNTHSSTIVVYLEKKYLPFSLVQQRNNWDVNIWL